MVITNEIHLPDEDQLKIPEVNLSTSALKASGFHLGRECQKQNNEFMLCREELGDPRRCLKEGTSVTNCALNFFKKVKQSCHLEFVQYVNCLDKSSGTFNFEMCRKTQGVFDKCMLENLKMERPDYGSFARAQIHHTDRPAPISEKLKVYPDATPGLPDEYPRAPAKYGSRFHWLE